MASLALAFDVLAKDRASKTFDKVGDSAEKAGRKGEGFGKGIGGGMKVAAIGLAGLAAGVAAGFGAFVKDAAESARIGRLTEAVVKSTGGAAKITAAQVGDLATAISNKTGADDEAIQSGANMLLTFTNVRNEAGKGNDVFNQATQTITDMSAALGQDTKSSAVQLGKALNDPIKGVTALSKVGVSFTQQQKDQIKTLVKSGDTLAAQKVILSELGKEFGGAATAASDPMSRLQVIAGNLGEKIGGALLPYIGQFADWVSNKAIPAVSRFVDWIGPKLGPAIDGVKKFIGDLVTKVQQFVTEFQNGEGAAGNLRAGLEQVGGIIQSVTTWVSENQAVVKTLAAAILGGVAAFQIITGVVKAYTAVQAVLNAVMAANPIGIVVIAIAALVAGFIYAYNTSETFRSYVSTAFSVVKIGALTLARVAVQAFQFLANVFMTVVGTILDGAAAAFGWVPGIGPKLQGAASQFNTFKNNANASLNAIQNDLQVNINTEQANIALEELHREFINKGWTVTAEVRTKMVYGANGQAIPARASGGPVWPGGMFAVGDNPDGSWNKTTELFVPDRAGHILTQRQMSAFSSTPKAGAAGSAAAASGGRSLTDADIAALGRELRAGAREGTAAGFGYQAREASFGGRY